MAEHEPPVPALGEFVPALEPSTNGAHRRPLRVFPNVLFGFLAGALLATSLVPRLQWLNLSTVGSWARPVGASLVAGAMAGLFRRHAPRAAAVAGAIAATLALWGVYGLVRLSVPVLFVERSVVRVVAGDMARLLAYAAPAGAAGALVASAVRAGIARPGRDPDA